jgi:hypothetical protein
MKRLKDGRGIVAVSPTTAGILAGELDLTEWDDDELLRGQRRNVKGKWTGRPPQVLPAALVRELTHRRFTRAHALLADSLVDAAQMLRAIVSDKKAPNGDRLRAAEIIFDRILGKPKESVSLDLRSGGEPPPWQRVAAVAIVGTIADAHDVIEGEIVETEEVFDDDAEESG